MSTADDAFAAGCEDGQDMPLDEETARGIARIHAADLKDDKSSNGEDAA